MYILIAIYVFIYFLFTSEENHINSFIISKPPLVWWIFLHIIHFKWCNLLMCRMFSREERKNIFSDFERDQIIPYNEIRMSNQRVDDKIKCSPTVIFNCLQNPTTYGITKSTGKARIYKKRYQNSHIHKQRKHEATERRCISMDYKKKNNKNTRYSLLCKCKTERSCPCLTSGNIKHLSRLQANNSRNKRIGLKLFFVMKISLISIILDGVHLYWIVVIYMTFEKYFRATTRWKFFTCLR